MGTLENSEDPDELQKWDSKEFFNSTMIIFLTLNQKIRLWVASGTVILSIQNMHLLISECKVIYQHIDPITETF